MSSLVSSVGSWVCPVCLPRLLAHEGSTRLPTKSRGRDFAFCTALSLKALTFSPKACYPPFSTKKNPLLLMCPHSTVFLPKTAAPTVSCDHHVKLGDVHMYQLLFSDKIPDKGNSRRRWFVLVPDL